jgi:hypothetical protein
MAGLALAILEVLAFTLGGVFSIGAAYLWVALGCTSILFLITSYLRVVAADARRLSLWGLLPLIAGIPLCFWNISGYAYLNTESLSEVQHAFDQLKRADLGYTQMFWFSYPSRSLLLAIVPSLFVEPSPMAYRLGFGIPMLLGALFFYTGLRRYNSAHPLSAPIAAVTASLLFAFPMLCEFTRTFEMAISSTSFGLWAIASFLLFVAQPGLLSAIACAWCVALVPASFTSGFALVALLWVVLGAWAMRALLKNDRTTAMMVSGVLIYTIVVTIALYLQQPRLLRTKPVALEEMVSKFQEAIIIVLSMGKTAFMPQFLAIPMCLAAVWALSLRGGLLPALCIAWCLPVLWSAVNMQGKIAPQLPFCLYRALIIIPVLLFVLASFAWWLTARAGKLRHVLSALLLLGSGAAAYASTAVYRQHLVIGSIRPALGREAIVEEILKILPTTELRASTAGIVVNKLDDPTIDNFLGCAQYLLHGWQRINLNDQIPPFNAAEPRPLVIVTTNNNPILSQNLGPYQQTIHQVSIPRHEKSNLDITIAILIPTKA